MTLEFTDLQYSDIYLVDQIFKGRIHANDRVLDIGCGSGRNLIPLEKIGCQLFGIDQNPNAISQCSKILSNFDPHNFFTGDLTHSPFQEQSFDLVICNALFHFAKNKTQFTNWSDFAWNSLKPGGMFFARLSTTIGLPDAKPPGFTFLASEKDIQECETRWGAHRMEPLKTTLVESDRTMTTWVLKK